jgi:MarR family transcriptional regulator, negative regulator of the multidrug operon emrRAB
MDARGVNLVATLGTMLGDAVADAVTNRSAMAGAAPAGLAVLLGEPGMSMDTFARTVGVTGSGGVRLVDRLTSAGLVERRAGRDARAVSLWLTPAGEAAADQVLKARREVVAKATATLDRAEQAALVRIAEKVLAAVTEDRAHAEWLCRLCDLDACPQRRCPILLAAP